MGNSAFNLAPGGAAAASFLGLTDTPPTYAGEASKICRVNAGASAIDFAGVTIDASDNLSAPGYIKTAAGVWIPELSSSPAATAGFEKLHGLTADGNDANTLLYIPCNGYNGSTFFSDISQYKNYIYTVGTAQISTAQSKFDGSSGLFNGAGNIYLADSALWYYTGDFTIDYWIWLISKPVNDYFCIMEQSTDGSNRLSLVFDTRAGDGNRGIRFTFAIGGSWYVVDPANDDANNWSLSTWYHVEHTRYGNVWKTRRNGVEIATMTNAVAWANYTGALQIGYGTIDTKYLYAHLSHIRISDVARHTADFTPPTEAYRALGVYSTMSDGTVVQL